MAGQHARDDTDDGQLRPRRRRPHPRRPSRPPRGRRVLPGRRQQRRSASSACCSPARTRSRASGSPASGVYTNTCGRCSYRGPWMMETVVREQMMDVVARQLGIDPLELRRRNVIERSRPAVHDGRGTGLRRGLDRRQSLEQAAAMIDYDAFRAEQAAARAEEGRLLGIGLGLYVEPSGLAMGSLAERGGDRQHRRERPGAGADEQRQPRPEPGDDDRPGRRRRARRRHRRRHGHPGRHRGDAVRAGHRRQPQRRARQRRRHRGGRAGAQPRCSTIAAHLLEAAPEDLEIVGGRDLGRRARRRRA